MSVKAKFVVLFGIVVLLSLVLGAEREPLEVDVEG